MGYTHLLNQLLKLYHVSEVYCYYVTLFSMDGPVVGPGALKPPVGDGPEGHWFTCHLYPFHSAPVFGVYNNNNNNTWAKAEHTSNHLLVFRVIIIAHAFRG